MKIIYTPQDNPVDGREEHDADLTSLLVGEVKLLEKVLGATFQEIAEGLEKGSATYMLALLWIYRRRRNTALELNDMDHIMRLSELEFKADEDDEAPEAKEAIVLGPKGESDPQVLAAVPNAV